MKKLRRKRNPSDGRRSSAVERSYRRAVRARRERFVSHEHVIPAPGNVPELAAQFPALAGKERR